MNIKAKILLLIYGGLVILSAIVCSVISRGGAEIANGIFMTGLWAVPAGLYLLPTFIAALRDAPNFVFIMLANIFAGWTGLVWLGCLIWAAVDARKPEPVVIQQIIYQSPPAQPPALPPDPKSGA